MKRFLVFKPVVIICSFVFVFGCNYSPNHLQNNNNSVVAGLYEWSIENLNVSVFLNGDPIPEAKTDREWEDAEKNQTPAWCYFNNDPLNGDRYGKLYNWYAINDPRGICPEGWHVPTKEEWDYLVDYLDNNGGAKLKSINGWNDDGNGTDSFGFGALPAGIRYSSGIFDDLGKYSHFWSSTAKGFERGGIGPLAAWHYYLSYRESTLSTVPFAGLRMGTGMSVRCVRRVNYDGFNILPSNPPNHGIMFVDNEATGRSGHLGLAMTECKNGDILAFYLNVSGVIHAGHATAGWTEYKRSTDGGKSWGDPVILDCSKDEWDRNEEIIEELYFKTFYSAHVSSAITAPNGNIIAMMSKKESPSAPEWQRKPFYIISYDNGYTWSEPREVDEEASYVEISMAHTNAASFVYDNTIYFTFIGDAGTGKYSFYASTDNGETFVKRSDDLFAGKPYAENYFYMSAKALEDGRFIVYTYNIDDEYNLPYVISEDQGYTWSKVQSTFMEKRVRNPQMSEKIGDYYFMHGRSGNWGSDSRCLVLYSSKDGINWDSGVFLNKVQQALDSYSANTVVGKYDSSVPKRLLIQASASYSGYRVNVKHWWIDNISGQN